MDIQRRIERMRRDRRKAWISEEQFECICGFTCRCKVNYLKHVKSCLDVKYGKQEI